MYCIRGISPLDLSFRRIYFYTKFGPRSTKSVNDGTAGCIAAEEIVIDYTDCSLAHVSKPMAHFRSAQDFQFSTRAYKMPKDPRLDMLVESFQEIKLSQDVAFGAITQNLGDWEAAFHESVRFTETRLQNV